MLPLAVWMLLRQNIVSNMGSEDNIDRESRKSQWEIRSGKLVNVYQDRAENYLVTLIE